MSFCCFCGWRSSNIALLLSSSFYFSLRSKSSSLCLSLLSKSSGYSFSFIASHSASYVFKITLVAPIFLSVSLTVSDLFSYSSCGASASCSSFGVFKKSSVYLSKYFYNPDLKTSNSFAAFSAMNLAFNCFYCFSYNHLDSLYGFCCCRNHF